MESTFEEYVAARGRVLLRFAYVLSGDEHLAQDLVQEVLARIHQRWHRLPVVEQPDAYLRTSIVRQFLRWRRRRSSGEVSLTRLLEWPASTPDPAVQQAARDEMWRLLATLPPRQRAVLVLRYYEDLPDREIAEVIGCRPATVRAHAARGLSRMREVLGSPDYQADPIGGTR